MTKASSLGESSEETPKGTNAAQSRRFTPLRSYMTRAQGALARGPWRVGAVPSRSGGAASRL